VWTVDCGAGVAKDAKGLRPFAIMNGQGKGQGGINSKEMDKRHVSIR